jgi:hypothetical protein
MTMTKRPLGESSDPEGPGGVGRGHRQRSSLDPSHARSPWGLVTAPWGSVAISEGALGTGGVGVCEGRVMRVGSLRNLSATSRLQKRGCNNLEPIQEVGSQRQGFDLVKRRSMMRIIARRIKAARNSSKTQHRLKRVST